MTDSRSNHPRTLQRDRVTWAGYAVFATFGWYLYTMGPTIPLLRDEQGTSRSIASLHSVSYAIGLVIGGLLTERVLARTGRRAGIRIGIVVLAVGGGLLVVASLPAGGLIVATVSATFVAGLGGALAVAAATSTLSQHHGGEGASAVTEGNALATATGLLAPLVMGAAIAVGLTWRQPMLVVLLLATAVLIFLARSPRVAAYTPVPRGDGGPGGAGASAMPRTYWPIWTALVACVMVETAFVTWTPDLLSERTGLTGGSATATISAFLAGMTLGRLAIARLVLRFTPRALFLVTLAVAILGWGVLFSTTHPVVALIGLGLSGLGAGGQFPLGSVLLIEASDGRPDRALGLMTVGVGAASGAGPFILGTLADATSIRAAFIMIPVTLAIALVVTSVAFRRSKHAAGG